jgi:putative transposase
MRTRQPARTVITPVHATHPGHVWPDDFRYDHGLKGTPLKVLTVMDEFTREGLAIEGATSLPAQRVLAVLARLVAMPGTPPCIRRDHGPECRAVTVRGGLARHQMTTRYIAPGSPGQNGYGERFNGTVREECLTRHVFHSVAEARGVLASYRRQDNAERPHSSLSYRTPAEFKPAWVEPQL